MKELLYNMFAQGRALDMQEIIVHILVSIVIGMAIFLSYWTTHAGTIYSQKFNVSLVMLTVLTTTVMTVIGNNIALSLGMVGALSIVRFRTAIKDSRDTVYIFWTIVVGICCGIGDYAIAAVSTIALFILLLILGRIKNDNRKLLIIRADKNQERNIESIVFSYFKAKANLRVMNTSQETVEFIYELSSRTLSKAAKEGKSITEAIYGIDGVECVNIVSQNDDING